MKTGTSGLAKRKLVLKKLKEGGILQALAEKASNEIAGSGKHRVYIDVRIRADIEGERVNVSVEKLKPLPEDYPTLKQWILEGLLNKVRDSDQAVPANQEQE